jgi:hypothetical protein
MTQTNLNNLLEETLKSQSLKRKIETAKLKIIDLESLARAQKQQLEEKTRAILDLETIVYKSSG